MNLNNTYSLFGLIVPVWLLISGGFIFSLIVTSISIPTIIKLSNFRKLYDVPNERASHKNETPVLGGTAIFSGFTLSAIIFSLPSGSSDVRFILGGLIILFFLGLKDDLMMLDPVKKILGQVLAASVVVILGDIHITSFHSVLGINSVSYFPGVMFSIFLVLLLINGFNLIDGVDGLSSGVGILASMAYGIWFILTAHYFNAILCFSLSGTLLAYFSFNVFAKKNKIFMGDTGAMIIGLIVSVFTIQFLEMEKSAVEADRFMSAPAIAFGILFVPLFDTLRIIVIRALNGRPLFKADKLHIHHLLLRFGYSHLKVSLILVLSGLIFLVIIYFIQPLGGLPAVILSLMLAAFITMFLSYRLKSRERKDPQ